MKELAIIIGWCSVVTVTSALPDSPRTVWDYAHELGEGSNMSVPHQSLQASDLDRWARILDMSAAQQRYMTHAYDQFVAHHNDFLDREAPQYLALTQELTEVWRAEGLSTTAFVDAVRRVDRANARMRRELTAIEHAFIDLIEPVLAPGQHERVTVLRHEATRRNCRVFHSFGRWMDVELREVWERAGEEIASPEQRRLVEDILDAYEAQLTIVVCRYADLQLQRRVQLAENRVDRRQGVVTKEQGLARYERIMRRRLDAARSVRRLHETSVDRIIGVLSVEHATMFRQAAREAAFPELYPDPNAIHQLLEALAADDERESDEHEKVLKLLRAYASEHEQLCDELETICVEWGDRMEAGIYEHGQGSLPDTLKPLLEERAELSRRHLETLIELFGPDVLARHADAIPAHFHSLLEEGAATGQTANDAER